MYTNPKLSLAAAVVAGMFVTGCSQQQVDGGSTSPSQVAGSSQQVAGSSSQQVAGSPSQQVAGSSQQQQAEPTTTVVTTAPRPAPPPRAAVKPKPRPRHVNVVKRNPNQHRHPAIPRCTRSVDHIHPNGAKHHNHKYSCKKAAPRPAAKRPVYRPPVRRPATNRWTHRHPSVPRCTKSVTHTHKFGSRNHSHKYSCRNGAPAPAHKVTRPAAKPGNRVNVHALQRKLKAKGYYRGPINGVVTPDTRSALQRYMKR